MAVMRQDDKHAHHEEYPPLITDRSPSYERAREERKHPSPAAAPHEIARLVWDFERFEHARKTYAAAAAAARDASLAERCAAKAAAHEAHRDELAAEIEALGGTPPRLEDVHASLEYGPYDIADARDDRDLEAALSGLDAELAGR